MAIPRNLANIAPHVNASSTELVVNDGGANLDFRVEGDTNANLLFVDAGNNRVGIGTSTPAVEFDLKGSSTNGQIRFAGSGSTINRLYGDDDGIVVLSADTGNTAAGSYMAFQVDGSERSRITSGGSALINTTSTLDANARLQVKGNTGQTVSVFQVGTNGERGIQFRNSSGTEVGYVEVNSSTTAYVTSSDYRLKENIVPMTGALDTVAQLKPVTYTWKLDGSAGQGFIAHELQAVIPDCVTGKKDAEHEVDVFDENGNKTGTKMEPAYQGVDTSFLVATLTAAIQELSAKNDALEARIAALEAQ